MSQGNAEIFPTIEETQWRSAVLSALKGQPFDRLVSRTPDGIAIEPLYARPLKAAAPVAWRNAGFWRIAQRVDQPEPFEANRQALTDLEGGADALSLVGNESASGRGFGVKLARARDLDELLSDVELDLISLRLDLAAQTPVVAQWLLDLARERHLVAAGLDVDIGFDPLGDLVRAGHTHLTVEAMGQAGADLSRKFRDAGFAGRVFLADGRPFHEAGASPAQELALVLAGAVTYLRLLEVNGIPLERAFGEIGFLLVADADAFLTIAKFRALRQLWARIAVLCGVAPPVPRVHAETAWRMQTVRDPWVNILRNALATFAAGLGGADAIAAVPFTLARGLPDEFARRIARNSQLILLRESHLGQVADPAAGAGGFEALTTALCETAWHLFQTIEAAGGSIASLVAGVPQGWIAASAAVRADALARRRDVLTGTSEFPDLAELPVAVLAPRLKPVQPAASNADAQLRVAALPSHRDSEMFEALREKADRQLAETGMRPKIFLANLGMPSAFLARNRFAAAFFAVAGIEAGPDEGFGSVAAVRAAYERSGVKLACICAADAQLQSDGPALIQALRDAGAHRVFVAARPQLPEVADLSGVTFVHQGCNSVAVLGDTLALGLNESGLNV
jgi:methylmalonyl-CoA mutase